MFWISVEHFQLFINTKGNVGSAISPTSCRAFGDEQIPPKGKRQRSAYLTKSLDLSINMEKYKLVLKFMWSLF